MGVLYWLFNAPMGYHQLAIALASQKKLAFQGPDSIKWTYCVMPFGPKNGPATFINFIHDVDSQWKALAKKSGLVINKDTNIFFNHVSYGYGLFPSAKIQALSPEITNLGKDDYNDNKSTIRKFFNKK